MAPGRASIPGLRPKTLLNTSESRLSGFCTSLVLSSKVSTFSSRPPARTNASGDAPTIEISTLASPAELRTPADAR